MQGYHNWVLSIQQMVATQKRYAYLLNMVNKPSDMKLNQWTWLLQIQWMFLSLGWVAQPCDLWSIGIIVTGVTSRLLNVSPLWRVRISCWCCVYSVYLVATSDSRMSEPLGFRAVNIVLTTKLYHERAVVWVHMWGGYNGRGQCPNDNASKDVCMWQIQGEKYYDTGR